MRCDEVQPSLLDYSEGLLTGPESEEVKAHLAECAECAALLEEEAAFSRCLAALPEEQPGNDVWALVRAKTKPRRLRPLVWLQDMMTANVRRATAAAVITAAMLVTLYSFSQPPREPIRDMKSRPAATVTVKWSDDPVGGHTDAVVDYIDSM